MSETFVRSFLKSLCSTPEGQSRLDVMDYGDINREFRETVLYLRDSFFQNEIVNKKISKYEAAYTLDPKYRDVICGGCKYFTDNQCVVVGGDISPVASCKYFDPMDGYSPVHFDSSERTKKIYNWQGLRIGLTHLAGDERFGKGLRDASYGRVYRTYGTAEDKKSRDCWVVGDPDKCSQMYWLNQLDPYTGGLDEKKLVISDRDKPETKKILQRNFPEILKETMFGGLYDVDEGELKEYRYDEASLGAFPRALEDIEGEEQAEEYPKSKRKKRKVKKDSQSLFEVLEEAGLLDDEVEINLDAEGFGQHIRKVKKTIVNKQGENQTVYVNPNKEKLTEKAKRVVQKHAPKVVGVAVEGAASTVLPDEAAEALGEVAKEGVSKGGLVEKAKKVVPHLAENAAAWTASKAVGTAVSSIAASKGFDPEAAKVIAEVTTQATVSTIIHSQIHKGLTAIETASHFAAQVAAASIGKQAHMFTASAIIGPDYVKQVSAAIAGKVSGTITASGVGKALSKQAEIVKRAIDKFNSRGVDVERDRTDSVRLDQGFVLTDEEALAFLDLTIGGILLGGQERRDAEDPDTVDLILEESPVGKKLDSALSQWMKKARSYSTGYDSPEALQKALKNPSELYNQLDPKGFVTALEQVMILADLVGRSEVLDEGDDEDRGDSIKCGAGWISDRKKCHKEPLYQEGEDSTFTSQGKTYSVDKLLKISRNKKSEKVEIKKLDWVLKYAPDTEDDKRRVEEADLSKPIIITSDPHPDFPGEDLVIADGVHRLKKAVKEGHSDIDAIYLSKEEMEKARIKNDSLREDAPKPSWLKLTPKAAIDFFRNKLNIPIADYKKMAEGYHNWAFSVAGVTRGDILDSIKFLTDEAISKGNSEETWNKQFDKLVAKKGWDVGGGRRKIIFDTNVRSAYAAGREEQMRDPVILERRPYWLWRHRDSLVPRPSHIALDNKAIPADSKFWDVCNLPAGYGCRCAVFAVSESQAKRMGAQILNSPPDPKTVAEEGFRGGRRPLSDEARQDMIERSLETMSPETRKVVEKNLKD
jgi:hypothetical protein